MFYFSLPFPCRSGHWYWYCKIHPDGARATLWYGADRGPVQVHLPGCGRVHTDLQDQRLGLNGEQQGLKNRIECRLKWGNRKRGVNGCFHCSFKHCSSVAAKMRSCQRVTFQRWTLTQRHKAADHADSTQPHDPSLCLTNSVSVTCETSLPPSSSGNRDRVWKSPSQTPTSEQGGVEVSEPVCVIVKRWSRLHSRCSSKSHTATLFLFNNMINYRHQLHVSTQSVHKRWTKLHT